MNVSSQVSSRPPFRDRGEFLNHLRDLDSEVPKEDLVDEYCAGKSVLDIGCIDHDHQTALELGDRWLHKRIKTVAKSVVGIDALESDALTLRSRGFDIRAENAESFDLGATFDVIVAGDLVEHLSNIGQFLDSVARHMHQGSVFLLTTPNPFSIEQFFLCLFEGRIAVNREHTVWIDPCVLWESVTRHGFEVVDALWISTRFRYPLSRRPWKFLANPVARLVMSRRPFMRRDFAVVLQYPAAGDRRRESS